MAGKLFKKYLDLTEDELRLKSRELKAKLFNLRLQKAVSKLEKPHMLKVLKTEVARCETRLSQICQSSSTSAKSSN